MSKKNEKKLAEEGTHDEKGQVIKVKLPKLDVTKFKGTH